ncbi:spore germination protein [Heliorestis convoluta]|uniref:Stage V sporulation protein AF n=1 Tax=Heliorestis convoluta TaxID=356322 RepID=A0A5Q2N2G4_9FIRM|nr:spore germination protein [Heliorestis convoluta]QGG48471.1 stage V sporulation protein AF [Heliorestis convoluta]
MGKKGTQKPLSSQYDENIDYLLKELRIEKNFDIIHHKMEYSGKKLALFFIDGFAKDESMTFIMKELSRLEESQLEGNAIEKLTRTIIPYLEIETSEDLEEVINQVLAGQAALVIEGCQKVILLDIREYPVRSPDEPDIERVVRGPRDGFVETIVFNCALIRRRIRDRSLIMEYMQAGERSKTDIAIAYIDNIADPNLVEAIKKKIDQISIDGLPMGEKTVEEFIFGRHLNPYPMVRYTERADTSAVHLMEGHVIIIVDGSPSVMICPTTFWHHLQHAEEYRQKPVIGAFLRWARFVAVIGSLFLLPLWYLVATNPELLGENWKFMGPEEVGEVSLFWQFFIAEIGLEILRMAAIHTPSALATALGLVAAILIGEVAVEVGLFTSEVILYLAVAAVGTFATPSYELSLANRIFRILFLIAAAVFGVYGFLVAVLLWFLLLATTRSLGMPYLWPLLPFDWKAFLDLLFRAPIPLRKTRSAILHPQDRSKQ